MLQIKQEIKDKWLAALRSGDYKKGEREFYNSSTNCFCVLGVLGDVCGVPRNIMDAKNPLTQYEAWDEIPEKAGLNLGGNANASFSEIWMTNDDVKNEDFTRMAQYVEANVEVFKHIKGS